VPAISATGSITSVIYREVPCEEMLEGFYPEGYSGERRATAVSLSAGSVYWGEGALITRGTYLCPGATAVSLSA
jgi:hypothetical protein